MIYIVPVQSGLHSEPCLKKVKVHVRYLTAHRLQAALLMSVSDGPQSRQQKEKSSGLISSLSSVKCSQVLGWGQKWRFTTPPSFSDWAGLTKDILWVSPWKCSHLWGGRQAAFATYRLVARAVELM